MKQTSMPETLLAGSILDLKAEITGKKEYNPPADIKCYIDAQQSEYMWDWQQFIKTYRVFNDRSFIEYLRLAQDDTYKFVPETTDPNDWRNFIRTGEERNKLDGLLAFLLDLNFRCEPVARDFAGAINEEMGEVAEAFLRYLNVLDETETKDSMSDFALYSVGTLFKQVKFTVRNRIYKSGKEWDPHSDFVYEPLKRELPEFEGVESTVLKPNRVFLGDVSQPRTVLQPHIWYESVVPYEIAYKMFHGWKMWQFVKPYNPTHDQWTDNEVDQETEQKTPADKVRVRWRESTLTDEYTIYCNKVLMTPPGLALPEGEYSIISQRAAELHSQFAYGRSFMDNVRPFVAVKDVLTSILVDKSRQLLEPPMKSRFRTLINRYMCKPGTVTAMQGEGDLTPLIPEGAMQNFIFEAIKVYDQMVDRSSISPVFQGQQTKGQMTKFEVEQMLTQSIRSVAGMIGAAIGWRRQESCLKLRIGLNHFSKITGFSFEVGGEQGGLSKAVKFQKLPATRSAHLKTLREMLRAENLFAKHGIKKRIYLIDPEATKDYTFVFDFRVNPQQRSSRSSDEKEMREKVALLRQAPNVDQRAVDRLLIKSLGESEDEFLKEVPEAPEAPPAGSALKGASLPGGIPEGMALPQAALSRAEIPGVPEEIVA